MKSELVKLPVIDWPTPPFLHPARSAAATYNGECTVELIDGRVVSGKLTSFAPGLDTIGVRLADSQALEQIELAQVRLLKLIRPVAFVPDTAKLNAVGTTTQQIEAKKPFVVSLHDGAQIKGNTLGFVKQKHGLFLFVVEGDSAQVVNSFIPASQIENLQIGPPLGDILVANNIVSAETVELALKKQAILRQERIGNYLADRAIISAEELSLALRDQAKRPQMRLGDILLEAQLVTPPQIEAALRIQAANRARRLGDILIEMGVVTVRLIQMALSEKMGIPYVNVREFKIGQNALALINTAFAIRHQVLALLRTPESLVVAVENPLAIDVDFMEDLRFKTGLTITPVIANSKELKLRIAKEYSNLDPRIGMVKGGATASGAAVAGDDARNQSKVADLAHQLTKESTPSLRPVKDVANDTRVSENTLVKLINKIIIEAHAQGASDIHIENNSGDSSTRIRFRKDGELEDYLELPPAYSNALVSRIKIMASLDISEHRHPQDGKIDFGNHGPLSIELRVAIIPTANNLEDVVMRILGGAEPIQLDQVGFSDSDLALLKKMIARTYGLILVCGPTGSGKTTTLHSILRDINRPDLKIWTAEDPIEITQPGLRQVQVQPKIDWTFAAAMRAFLRADPDVIMVGEMRDAETTKIGIEASLTGHLVFSTLHTNSAAESIVRLLDLGMDPFNFADAVIGILSQRLARKLCPNCKESHVANAVETADLVAEYCLETTLDPAAVLERWTKEFATDGHLILRTAAGCDACRDGYKGRIVVYELLAATPEVKHLIRTRAAVPQLLAVAQRDGMRSLRQAAIEKVLSGVLDLNSARSVSS
jgi:type II secretory ATPase GspE/PulE/Tfp pilus assembly ATPase PilB-like protein